MRREYKKLLSEYPEYVSKEQMYKICHISKRTALHLLKNGLVPAKKTGERTSKYKIAMRDIVAYLEKRDVDGCAFLPPDGWYSGYSGSRKENFHILSPETEAVMRSYFEMRLAPYPDLMNVRQVVEATGYGRTTIDRWCAEKRFKRYRIGGAFRIPKIALIDFMLGDSFRGIRRKSETHKEFWRELRGMME